MIRLPQSFDHDFGCGESADAKDLWERWDGFIAQNLTYTASLVSEICDDFGYTIRATLTVCLGCRSHSSLSLDHSPPDPSDRGHRTH